MPRRLFQSSATSSFRSALKAEECIVFNGVLRDSHGQLLLPQLNVDRQYQEHLHSLWQPYFLEALKYFFFPSLFSN